jgi:muramoyltetrapeptide carboxypeptidase
MDMFKDRKIDAIMCARGGTGSIRLLDKLDYKLIKKNAKPFIGFSDITFLLQAINRQCGFPTFHGPLMWNFAHDYNKRTATDLLELLQNKDKKFTQHFSNVECVRAGTASGILTGGNITMLQRLIGTSYEWQSKGAILFIEDVDEVIYKLAEKLQHMKLAGKFDGVKAVIVGEMIDIADGESGFARKGEAPYGRSFRDILLDVLPKDIPLCFNFPCGHGKYLTTLPVGAKTKLVLNAKGAELTFMQA